MKESKELLELKAKLAIGMMNSEKEEDDEEDEMESKLEALYSYLSYLEQIIYACNDRQYKHSEEGHLPKLNGSAVKKLLDVAGVGEDYEVQKRVIYASNKNISATIN